MPASIITAYDQNRIMGDGFALPWNISKNTRLFTDKTVNTTVIMGRTTWELCCDQSHNKLYLPKRVNIVISSNHNKLREEFAKEVEANDIPLYFVSLAQAEKMARDMLPQDCFVIGGASIFKHFLEKSLIDEIHVSHIRGEHEGDVFFPYDPEGSDGLFEMKWAKKDNDVIYKHYIKNKKGK